MATICYPANLYIPLDAITGVGDIKSISYSLPYLDRGKSERIVIWVTSFVGGPSAVSLQLQGALEDIDGDFVVLDSSTLQTGEGRTIINVCYPYIRIRQVSRTGGTSTTVKMLIN